MIDEALISSDPLSLVPSTDANGHGSVMASLAAGSSIEGGRFIGAAPGCQIAVVKLREAKQYLKDYYKIPSGVPCYGFIAGNSVFAKICGPFKKSACYLSRNRHESW